MSSELKFESYEPIKNIKRTFQPNQEDMVVITEKVHGANFSIYILVDSNYNIAVNYASRSGFITPNDSFFNNVYIKVMNKYLPNIAAYIKTEPVLKNSEIRIIGELYGGWLMDKLKMDIIQ